MEYEKAIRDFIVGNMLFGDDNGLEADTSFLESGIVDSTGIMELVAFVEETYKMEVGDDELLPENFDSILNLAAYIARKKNGNK